jgi:hypothetical protein
MDSKSKEIEHSITEVEKMQSSKSAELQGSSTKVEKADDHQKEGRRGAQFPWKLHDLLEQVDKDGLSHIVSWLPGGKAFKVHKKEEFCNKIMPHYFASNKYKTWQRSLNLRGFESVVRGPDKGACHHRSFVRGHPDLCKNMTRVKIKGSMPETSETSKSISIPQASQEPLPCASTDPNKLVASAASTSTKPAISDFLRSKANSRRTDAILEAEIMRRMSAQLSNPLGMIPSQQGILGHCQSFPPPLGANNWLAAQLTASQIGASMGVPPFVPPTSGNRLLSAINTAAAALDVIRQEEAEILRRQIMQTRL